jgi:DNA-binding PadR family transcriptional regulator
MHWLTYSLPFVIALVALERWWRWRRLRMESAILFLVTRRGPMPSLAIRQALGGGNVYPVLRRLERDGLLFSWEEPGGDERGGLSRRVYSLWPRR